ncbi:helix-hairpin-helix domain-containing protein [Pelosinus sp. sgz500959]|uniref:helix-hairpin-helix domain-containing protein n=1 Tax=Pelosinus sp. sgz500959 TaxID=3242472 RepID=UPI003670A0A8
MGENGKKVVFIITLAILIVAGSFYSFWQKHSVNDSVSTGEVLAKENKNNEVKTSEMVVYISGAINKPGVFKLPSHARVAELITLAGGLTPEADLSKINLAQLVKDGMHIHVAAKTVVQGGGNVSGSSGKTKSGEKININTADKTELDQLPGVGPALAERIIEYRQKNGSFNTIEEFKKVPGIGSSKFEALKDKIIL